jgi:hypothetical protein
MRKPSVDVDPELQPTIRDGEPVWRPKWQAYIVAFILINSVTTANAAFILFASDLEPKLSGENTDIMLLMCSLAVIFHLISRYIDMEITKLTEKTPLWRHQSVADLRVHLSCLGLILLVKIAGRHLLHQSLFPMLQIVSSRDVMPPLAEQMPLWLAFVMAGKAPWPKWVTRLLQWVIIPVQIYAFYVFRNSLEKILAEESPKSESLEKAKAFFESNRQCENSSR